MERRVSDKNILNDFAEKFCYVIDKHTKYIIVSGFVAISSGRARGTEDIDMIIPRQKFDDFKRIHNDLIKNDFVCMQSSNPKEIFEYLDENSSVRYTHKDRPLPEMELKFAKDELDIIQIKERTKIELSGLDIWFSNIEMNIAFKEEYLKADKDLEDARHLRIVFSDSIDENTIKRYKELIRRYRL